jgi:hypothetical protein
LALRLGIWNVEEWIEQLDWGQALAWRAYAQIEPFGEERADLRSGIVASVIANVNRDPKKGKAFNPQDFMPKFGSEASGRATGRREPMTQEAWREVKAMAKAIYAS